MTTIRRAAAAVTLTLATPVFAQDALEEVAPAAPTGVAATYRAPPRDAAGYLTPNRDLGAAETLWHVRVALNVAALACRDAREGETVARYNAFLADVRAPLAEAQAGTVARYRERFGGEGQARYDDQMTRLYNFFAASVAHDAFCGAAQGVLAEAATVEPGDLPAFAGGALARMEAPFTAFFARWDAYRTARAGWDQRQARVTVIATTAPVPVAPAAAPGLTTVAAVSFAGPR